MTTTTKLFLSSKLKPIFERMPDSDGGTMSYVAVHTKLLKAVNEYNPKMKVTEIRFVPQKESFKLMKECDSQFFGIFAETLEKEAQTMKTEDEDVWLEETPSGVKIHKAVAYAIIVPEQGSRNIVVAQQAFPTLFTLIGRNLDSPGLTLTDRPVYLIDLCIDGHEKQESSIRRSFIAMMAAGLAIVCPFHENLEFDDLLSMSQYVEISSQRGESCISLDESTRTVRILGKHNGLFENAANAAEKKISVFGSNEKFYATTILGGFSLARRLGYKIDLSSIQDAFTELENKERSGWRITGDKYGKINIILNYMEKILRRQ